MFTEQTENCAVSETIPIMMGRTFTSTASHKGTLWASFTELCDTERGAADYKAIAAHFHTVFVYDIPKLSMAKHNQVDSYLNFSNCF